MKVLYQFVAFLSFVLIVDVCIAEVNDSGDRSMADRVIGVNSLLSRDEERRKELEIESKTLSEQLEQTIDQIRRAGQPVTGIQSPDNNLSALATRAEPPSNVQQRALKANLDRIIRRRKILHDQLQTLAEKIEVEQNYLRQLVDPTYSEVDEAVLPPTKPTPAKAESSSSPVSTVLGVPPALDPNKVDEELPVDGQKSLEALATTDERVVEARKERDDQQAELRRLERGLAFVIHGIDVFESDLETSQAAIDSRQEELALLQKKLPAPVQGTNLTDEQEQLRQQQESIAAKLRRDRQVIAETQAVLVRLKERRNELASDVTQAENQLSQTQTWLLVLESPLSPSRMIRWATDHGPKILGVLLIALLIWGLARIIERRLIAGILIRHETADSEQRGRTETLRRVFRSFSNVAILTLGILAALDQAGINVTVLLGGAAVLGAAIAFGSQNLIKDYFSGFMILVENQYNVGNVISLGNKAGVVEDISLRMTTLRDEEGIVHFIPHSQVTTVINMTHGCTSGIRSRD